MTSRLLAKVSLNAAPIGFDRKAKLVIGTIPTVEGAALDALRAEYQGVHHVRRGRDGIDLIARTAASPRGTLREVEAGRVPHLVAGLLKEWLVDHLVARDRSVMRVGRQHVLVSEARTDDLLSGSLPPGVVLPDWIRVRVAYTLDARALLRGQRDKDVVLICEARSKIFLDAPVSELLRSGFDPRGTYVRRREDDAVGDERLMPRYRLAGRVFKTVGGKLQLDDHDGDLDEIDAADAFLEPRNETLDRVIRHVQPRLGAAILQRLATKRSAVVAGPERLGRIKRFFEYLEMQDVVLAPRLRVDFAKPMRGSQPRFPPTEVIEKPRLIFDAGGNNNHPWNQGGLDQYGPHDRYYFTPKRLHICVICQRSKEGRVDEFVKRLLDGLPGESGFLRRFALDQPALVKIFTCESAAATDYLSACNAAVRWAADEGKEWDLALVQIDDGMAALNGDSNPYLVTKAFFLRHSVAVQDVKLETMAQSPGQLKYTLNNIGLASYAKLGGVPWILPADQMVAHELVFGLGSYQAIDGRFGPRKRFVGITTVFTGDGRYLLGSRTEAVPFEEYRDALLKAIRSAVEGVREQQAWRVDDPIRLIFHAFKPLRNAEVEAVEGLMRSLNLTHARYAFLHVVVSHSFLLFNEAEGGASAPGGKKGIYAPPRGLCLLLSDHEVLVALKGAREVKQASDGLPRPVMLRLHRGSTFHDMVYLSRQVFSFSCHSWRSFFPAPMPITIGYSELIAEKLRLLQDVTGWSDDAVGGRIGRTRWFL